MNRERATAAHAEALGISRVTNGDAAAVARARSEFSIISGKPVSAILFCYIFNDVSHGELLMGHLSRSKTRSRPMTFQPRKGSLYFPQFWPASCLRNRPEKQAIAGLFCRNRENR